MAEIRNYIKEDVKLPPKWLFQRYFLFCLGFKTLLLACHVYLHMTVWTRMCTCN